MGLLGFFFEENSSAQPKDKVVANPKLTKTSTKEVVTAKHSIGETDGGQTMWKVDSTKTVDIEIPIDGADRFDEKLIYKISSDINSKFTDKSPNYLNFFSSVQEMIANGGEIKSATSIAYGIFKNIGLTKDILLVSANKYKELILTEKSNFNNALLSAIEEDVNKPKRILQQNLTEIELLTTKIEELKLQNTEISAQYSQAEVQINEHKLAYMFNMRIIEQATNEQIETISNLN